tara:strand:+ start:423 stop:941 length:519 start_codon:yes stop_codon:yes gene_type:complete
MENICDWKNCKSIGKFKAPKEKDNSKNFRWFCLEHIKEFNKSWDYFSDMSENQILDFIRSDITWHKPTQSFGSSDNFFNILWNDALNSQQGLFKKLLDKKNNNIKKFTAEDIKAFNVMNIEVGTNWPKIQSKFKILVKKFHPDMNAGSKKFEDKLKTITLAYSQLKETYKEK